MKHVKDLKDLIQPRFPGLLTRIQKLIEDSEEEYQKKDRTESQGSYLWEHTLHTANIAQKICLGDNKDPILPVIAALFHDAGKFIGGHYHEKDIPEEQIAARLAREILSEEGMDPAQIHDISEALRSLYSERSAENTVADVVHDADFLAKSGYLGVAHFFIKSTLRGHTLLQSLIQSLSKEFTYASVLPENMRTKAGRTIALKKSERTLSFYKGLLQELRDHRRVHLEIEEISWPCPKDPRKQMKLLMVFPEKCTRCGKSLNPKYSSSQGIKCTKLIAEIKCQNCPEKYDISFCLPEIPC
jgi:HD superfamily phosphodiesterase